MAGAPRALRDRYGRASAGEQRRRRGWCPVRMRRPPGRRSWPSGPCRDAKVLAWNTFASDPGGERFRRTSPDANVFVCNTFASNLSAASAPAVERCAAWPLTTARATGASRRSSRAVILGRRRATPRSPIRPDTVDGQRSSQPAATPRTWRPRRTRPPDPEDRLTEASNEADEASVARANAARARGHGRNVLISGCRKTRSQTFRP